MKTQDLKNNREAIIDMINTRNEVMGWNLDIKTVMTTLLEFVEFGLNETEDVIEFVESVLENTFRPVSRKLNKVAESTAEAVFQGKQDEFNIKKYYANK